MREVEREGKQVHKHFSLLSCVALECQREQSALWVKEITTFELSFTAIVKCICKKVNAREKA